jgi:UDP-GlcNAc:undecaprenyl-phosphate GlcNAc-1-phosphate transferase
MGFPVEVAAAVFAAAVAASVFLTAAARPLARRVGLVDQPDGRRKVHGRSTPVAGGLAVFAAAGLVLGAAAVIPGPVADAVAADPGQYAALLAGAAVICLVGVVDDRFKLPGKYKLVGQAAAAAVVVAGGATVESVHLFGRDVHLGWLGVPVTLAWLLGAVNSFNLIDGMDGLLGTLGVIVCGAVAVMAGMHGQVAEACVAAALAGALVGFLRYNLPPASIFLGDAGSMLVGLVVGVLAIRCSLKGPATVALAAPAALLTIPFLDTAAAIVRRKLTGRSIYSTDRGHLHHCLLRGGMSRPGVLLLVSGLSSVTVVGVLASIALRNEVLAVLSAAAVVVILVATRLFGHAEFVLLVSKAKAVARAALGPRRGGREIQVRIQGSAGWAGLWTDLTAAAARLNLHAVALDVNAPLHHEGYHARWHRAGGPAGEDAGAWSAVIPLTAFGQPIGQVAVAGLPDGVPAWQKMAELAAVADGAEALLARPKPAAAAGPAVALATPA